MEKILALIGNRFHNHDYIKVTLDKIIVEAIRESFDYSNDITQWTEDTLKPYKLLIILRDGFHWPEGYLESFDGIPVISYPGYPQDPGTQDIRITELPEHDQQPVSLMTEKQGCAIKNYLNHGGGILFLHNSSHISLTNADYRDIQGGAFLGHPPVRPFTVNITNKEHPITQGVGDFVVTNKQHFVAFDKDPKHILMYNENKDGLEFEYPANGKLGTKSPAGWAYEMG